MKSISVLLTIFILIIVSVANNIPVLYPLAAGLVIAGTAAAAGGHRPYDIWKMAWNGTKKSAILFSIFALIGIIISMWMASGTVPGLMYYGLTVIKPDTAILVSFLLTAAVSMFLGTSFGTVSTIGIALMAVGRGFGISPAVMAGAVISGAYLGDRSSPMSSSAILTASVTESKIYENLKHMVSTLLPALAISIILYFLTGILSGSKSYDMSKVIELQQSLKSAFNLTPLVLIPPVLIVLLSMFKVNIKINMLVGIIVGAVLAVFAQGYSVVDIAKYSLLGYDSPFTSNMLSGILTGGGIISMMKAALTIAVSSALNGIFEGTGMLNNVFDFFTKEIKNSGHLVIKTVLLGLITAMYGCSQALSIMLTGYIMKPAFNKHNISSASFARTLADSCVVLSPLVPWNIAGLVPAANMGVNVIDYIPYAYFCLVLPIISIAYSYMGRIKKVNLQ